MDPNCPTPSDAEGTGGARKLVRRANVKYASTGTARNEDLNTVSNGIDKFMNILRVEAALCESFTLHYRPYSFV